MELFNSLKTGIERERKGKRVCLNQAVPYTLLCFPKTAIDSEGDIGRKRRKNISPNLPRPPKQSPRSTDSPTRDLKRTRLREGKRSPVTSSFWGKEFATRARAGTASAHQDPEGITITIQN